ncbi:MAG: cyclodeaminase/cyclohydrolase family protein, partial [bacterium]
VAMVARLTIGRKAYAAAEARAREILAEAETLRGELRRLVDDDAAAYTRVSDAYKIPKDDPSRGRAIDAALLGAAHTPLEAARRAERLIRLAREIGTIGNKNARSDARVAEGLAQAALEGALENVRINVASLSDPALGRGTLEEATKLAGS